VIRDLFLRLRTLFSGTAVDGEIDDELRFHIDRQIESYKKAGLTDAEAARRARLEFGGIEQVKEEVRDATPSMRSARSAGSRVLPRSRC